MADYLVRSPGLLTEGSSSADYFQVDSGVLSSTSINGLAGADTVSISDSDDSAGKVSINLAGDKDVLTASGIVLDSASTLVMGAGADLVVGSDSEFAGSLKLGDGNDTLTMSAGAVDSLYAGGGTDRIIGSAIISGTAAVIGLGAGNDTLALTANFLLASAQIFGGGGADSIILSGSNASFDGGLINLDSDSTGGGADTLTLNAFSGASATIKGKGGADVITFAGGSLIASSQVLGNAGADSITIDEISSGSNVTVGGGSGNDTIVMTGEALSMTSTVILGGGGRDSLNIDAMSGANVGGTIFGGAGTDSITFSADLADSGTEMAYAIGFQAFTDSTADSADLYTFTNSLSGAAGDASGTIFNIAMDGIGSAQTAEAPSLNSASITSGVATFSSVSAVSDRISKVDALITTTGQYALFGDNEMSAAYLFIQGGANDIVTKFVNTHGALTGLKTEAVAGSAFNISMAMAD